MNLIVGIDGGHGGGDPGATSPAVSWTEEGFNSILSRIVLIMLRQLDDLDVCPCLIRPDNGNGMSLRERGHVSERYGCHLVLNIHVNAHKQSWVHGGETYFWPANMLGRCAAEVIARSLPAPLMPRRPRAIEAIDRPETDEDDWIQAPRAVMGVHDCTTVLLECGYLSHANDRQALEGIQVQHGLALACCQGVVEFQRMLARK